MVIFNASFVHMFFLVVEGIQLSYGADLFLCGLGAGGRFYLFNVRSMACKSIMLVCLLRRTM
jgi:hypothetical protein